MTDQSPDDGTFSGESGEIPEPQVPEPHFPDRSPDSTPPPPPEEPIPLGQRLFDSPFLLLIAGLLIMFIFFTGWGLWEVLSLTDAPLP